MSDDEEQIQSLIKKLTFSDALALLLALRELKIYLSQAQANLNAVESPNLPGHAPA